ncbi:hypothetical protein HPB51_023949 [Rhipicephalus microplus]|uniref:KIF21A/B second helical domain-containing protein n=1 Tax=Rhipicephalus microplus TaxID=6941 RepID=A0A9J6DDL6_RHIMP|nr:hypothetical protein HPB51_023949 [Rhipicephalus microplus]
MWKREKALRLGKDTLDMINQIDSMRAHLNYLNENILEHQALILQMDTKDDTDCRELDAVFEGMVDTRGRYLLDKVFHMAINQSVQAAQSKSHVQELEVRLKQVEATNVLYQNLRQHTMKKMQPKPLAPPCWSEEPEHTHR